MKLTTRLALLGAIAILPAQGAVTDPVGYVTVGLETGFNLVGISLHEATEASGTFSAVGAASVTDDSATFTTALDAGSTYLLEITAGAQSGALQVFTSFTDTEITTSDDLAAVGVVAGDSYTIRKASTINSIFGADNSAGLLESDSSAAADVIWVPDGSGGYNQYYRNQGLVVGGTVIVAPSWQTLAGVEAGETPLVYTDGMFIERKGGAMDLTVVGEVKMTSTRVVVPTGFSLANSGFPVGLTLGNSGLETSLTASDSPASADIIWVPSGPGTYDQYYYNQGLIVGGTVIVEPAWQTLAGVEAGSTVIEGPVFIERKGADTGAEIAVPY